jgi:hypothetical protein
VAGTAYERIAVRGTIQRCGGVQCPPGTCNHDENQKIHRFADHRPSPAGIPASVTQVLGTPGRALDALVRADMEERFGHDFAHVRVHTDTAAAWSADAINARAYVAGRHVVMGRGQFQPHTASGRHLLAHELAHVIQQGNPAHETVPPGAISRPGDASERQADHIAALAGSSGSLAGGHYPLMSASTVPLIARQEEAGVPDADAADAGPQDAGVAVGTRTTALSDPMYPLQAGCVAEQGGCQQYLPAGVADPAESQAKYNSECRRRTKYNGPDMWPSEVECEQAKNGAILDSGKLGEFKALLLEFKVRLDAGQLAPEQVRDCEAAVQAGLQALQRAGLTEERIAEAARKPPDPQVTQAFIPGVPVVLRLVAQGGRVALVSEPAALTATAVTGGEIAAGAGTGAATAAAGTTGVAVAAPVAAGLLIGLVVIGLGVLIAWALLQPAMRLDPVAPQLLNESMDRLRNSLRRSSQPHAQPEPTPQPEPAPGKQKRPREKCLEMQPSALTCDDTEADREEVVIAFLLDQGYGFTDLGDCHGYTSHGPGDIDACDGAPGETWHCNVKGTDQVVSVFACLCCDEAGNTSYVWRGAHWSQYQGKRGTR